MIFIPKPGKPSYKVAKSWRPISLTNYLLKGLERLCAWQVDGVAEQNPVHTLQHGFRTDRNTDTALSSVVNNLEKGTYLDQDTIAIFLDIAAAFDTICPGLIKRKLLEHGGDPLMVNWYYNFITHRNLHVEINGTTASKTVCIGFPQGGGMYFQTLDNSF